MSYQQTPQVSPLIYIINSINILLCQIVIQINFNNMIIILYIYICNTLLLHNYTMTEVNNIV